jgi:hypothetical protein
MTSEAGIWWAVVVAGIQTGLGLCAAIMVYLIWTRRKARRTPAAGAERGAPPGFTQEMIQEVVSQSVTQVLDSITQAVEAERRRLHGACGTGVAPHALPGTPFHYGGEAFVAAPPRCDILPGQGAAAGRYEGVHRLTAAGLNARQIAERLNLPAGEVELVVKLQAAPAVAGE